MPRLLLILCLFHFNFLAAQELITLKNPSFEDKAEASKTPAEWFNCQFEDQTPVDVLPGSYGVSYPAKHGKTYLGMVVRSGISWEGVSQELSAPLQAGKSYIFSAYICRAVNYLSLNLNEGTMINFNYPVKLQIWGGNSPCEAGELLAETALVTNTEWVEFIFQLKPKATYSHLKLEAKPQIEGNYSSSGNVLVDYCSAIREVDQEREARTDINETMPNETKPKPDSEAVNSYFLYEIDNCLINTFNAEETPKSPQLARIFRLRLLTYQGISYPQSLAKTEREQLYADLKAIQSIRLAKKVKSWLAAVESPSKKEEGEQLDLHLKSRELKDKVQLYLWNSKRLIERELEDC